MEDGLKELVPLQVGGGFLDHRTHEDEGELLDGEALADGLGEGDSIHAGHMFIDEGERER